MKRWRAGLVASTVALSVATLVAADTSPATVRSLRLVPQDRTLLGAKASQQFLVLATYSDGLERDVTSQSKFSLTDSKVAAIDAAGRLTALANGRAVLSAHFSSQSVKTGVRVDGSAEKLPFSFARDIGAILTKNGCNDSSCHGGVKGKGGLKLSLNALYPRDDYQWIVEGGTYKVLTTDAGEKIPRVNVKEPEKSLLLLKPTMLAPHGGGLRFPKGSPDYEAILNWVKEGAPYGEEVKASGIEVTRVEVTPKEVVLEQNSKHRLLVTAYFSDGRQQDLTNQVLYVSNNPEVAKVDGAGQVQAVRTGETSVMIRAAGQAVSAVIGVVAKPIANYPKIPQNNFVDEHVFAKLRKFNIIPSELSSDSEFLRRVCLDLTGTLPPPERIREFVASKDPRKRDKLVEVLLSSPEFVDYWTFRFAGLFRVGFFQNGFNTRWTESYWQWIRDNVARNTPYDQWARERLISTGYSPQSRHWLNNAEVGHPENRMAEEVRVFMGRRLDCAQCHNHPFESWSQDQFWGMTAFFGRMDLVGGRGEEFGTVIYETPSGEDVVIGRSGKVVNPRTKAEVKPVFLDGAVPAEKDLPHVRTALAQWMTSHPYFAEAAVNRIWGYFFSRGIVDPVDDFRSTNPPTNPTLLKALAEEFRKHGYDWKHLIRVIVNSRTYQLSSEPNESNKDDLINYSHALPRGLDAEVLFDAISQATGAPDRFEQVRDKPGVLPPGTRAIGITMPDVFQSRALSIFGRGSRAALPERNVKPNLGQALHMLAGGTFNEKLSRKSARLEQLLRSESSDARIIEELYLTTVSRFPTEAEKTELAKFVAERPRPESFQDLFWGLLASREFSENH